MMGKRDHITTLRTLLVNKIVIMKERAPARLIVSKRNFLNKRILYLFISIKSYVMENSRSGPVYGSAK